MRTFIAIVLFAQLGFITGCANKETAYANIYEGLRTRNAILNPAADQKPGEKPMSYQEYEAERTKLLETYSKQ